jgi:DNA repair photolyase
MNGKPVLRVPVKTVLNLDSGFAEKLLCDGPALALGDACAYSCSFCYVPAVYQKLDRIREAIAAHNKANGTELRHEDVVILREGALDVLRGQLLHPNGMTRHGHPEDRRVVYSSPADDVAANMDLVNATVEACKLILTHTHWQIRLLSKSNLLPKLAAILTDWGNAQAYVKEPEIRKRMIFGVSTGTLDDNLAKVFEEGTPAVSKRIKSLHVLQDAGFRTFAMVCPSLPLAGAGLNSSAPIYDAFAERACELLRYEKCEHVWAEVINLRGHSFDRTVAALRAGGFYRDAELVEEVSHSPNLWESYNRDTFLAHAKVCDKFVGKLRFLTYVEPSTRAWWEKQIARGAVILGGKK